MNAGESQMAEAWGGVKVSTSDGNFEAYEVPEAGAHAARICALVDIGTHEVSGYQGAASESKNLVVLGFELAEKNSKGQSFFMSKLYTLSMHVKANFYAMVRTLH